MLTYKKNGWPDIEHPVEIYLHVYRDKERVERIVIHKSGMRLDIDIKLETKEEVYQLIQIVETAWRLKIEQDHIGWNTKY